MHEKNCKDRRVCDDFKLLAYNIRWIVCCWFTLKMIDLKKGSVFSSGYVTSEVTDGPMKSEI